MKVVLKTAVLDRILADIEKAMRERRLVDYVLVTPAEYAQLRDDRRAGHAIESSFRCWISDEAVDPSATFTTWDLEYTGSQPAKRHRRIRVPSNETIYGHPLLVAPADYHPR
jgi:hypothetical protein